MKLLILATLAATISFSSIAAKIALPQVNAPSELTSGEFAEGTVTQLSASEVAEFLPWAQNSRNQLNRAMTQSLSLPLRERLPHIERAVRAVVERSGNRQYQMMMRFSLNRGLLLVDELERNVNMNEIGSQESALDILQRSINIGLSFYESDLAFQQRAQSERSSMVTPHAQFASAFMQGMYPGLVNVLDATAQYRMLYKLIEMVNWDLSRDTEANRYAEIIVEAYEMGQDLPEQPSGDDKANLRMIRRLNSLRIVSLRSLGIQQVQNNNEADMPITSVLNGNTEYGPGVDPSREMITCSTSSNGYNFSAQVRDARVAKSQAISKCTASSSTENAECQANLSCNDNGNYSEFISCSTSSRGYNFSHSTRDRQLSYNTALSKCKGSDSTDNVDCHANITCEDNRSYPEFVRCSTSSNGYNFSYSTRDRKLSLRTAISQCKGSDSTNNSECSVNAICEDGRSYPPFIKCSTSSNGYYFSETTRSRDLSLSQAISQCTSSGSTNNDECRANYMCSQI